MVEKKPPGVSPAVSGDSLRCLVCVCACLSGRRAVREPKIRKEMRGAEKHGLECSTAIRHSRPRVPRFTLTAHGEHEDHVDFGEIPVQGNVAARATADDKFPMATLARPADLRASPEHVDGRNDVLDAPRSVEGAVPEQVIEDAVEVVRDFRRKFNLRQRQRASFVATGRTPFLPAPRSSR